MVHEAPDSPASSQASAATGPKDASHRRVLVVDDYKETACTMARLLGMMGHEVQTAHDGPEAIATAGSFRPDVVLLDLGLPTMSGHEVARRLRQELGAAVLLIALTGRVAADDERRSREAGFDEHIVKPVKVERLEALLQRR